METDRKGQFSTYLKPVLVIVFGFLMILVVQQILGFQISLGEEEASIDFVSQVRRNFQKVSHCTRFEGEDGGRYVLSSGILENYQDNYQRREPPCAEDFDYGYSVEVETRCDLLNTGADCQDISYSFGELEGSDGRSLENSVTLTYPVLLRKSGNNMPAEMEIRMRDGELETLAGGFNKVLKKGDELGDFNMTFSFVNDKRYCTSGDLVCTGDSTDNCVKLREDVPPLSVEPGSHIIRFRYSNGLEEVRGVQQEGCGA